MEMERISGTRIDTPQKKDRWLNAIFGKNIKEFDNRDLIRWFDLRNEEEAANLKIGMNNLKKQLQAHPEREKDIMKAYEEILNQMVKSKQDAAERKYQAFEKIQ
jgi:hypothetical protein